MAIDAGGVLGSRPTVGIVRTAANDLRCIGQALDAGAAGVIVPMIENAEAAREAVRNAKYPPLGRRSYGPMRSELRRGPDLAVVNDTALVAVMIETAAGLEHVEEIAAAPGVDALYVGPYDLTLAIGGGNPDDPAAVGRATPRCNASRVPDTVRARPWASRPTTETPQRAWPLASTSSASRATWFTSSRSRSRTWTAPAGPEL